MNKNRLYFGVGLLIGVLLMGVVTYALTPSDTTYISSGVYPGAPIYTIFKDGSTYFAKNAQGQNVYSGTNASYVINSAIYAVQYGDGGTILLEPANYVLTQKIFIDTSTKGATTKAVGLIGEEWSGNAGYIHDIDNIPFSTTVIEPDASYHGNLIQIGKSTDSNYKSAAVRIEYLVLSGIPTSSPKESRQGEENITMTNDCAAIMGWNVEYGVFKYMAIFNAFYGMYFTTGASSTNGPIIIENVHFGYNTHHLRLDGQTYGVSAHNLFGYLSYRSGFMISVVDGLFDNIISNADNYENTTFSESTFWVIAKGFTSFQNIKIQNSKDGTYAGIRGIYVIMGNDASLTVFDNILIQGVNGDAVRTSGDYLNCTIRFSHLYASPSPTQIWGGEGRNLAWGFNHAANNTRLFIEDSDLSNNGYGPWQGETANATLTNVYGYP